MTALGGAARRRAFGIQDPRKVFSQPGFAPEGWERFAPVIESLALGYNASLVDSSTSTLVPRLDAVEPALHGFAYEGAAMGLGALDVLAPGKHRLTAFAAGPGAGHIATVYVGLGLALARLRRRPERYLDRLDPVLGWAVVDGYGFHEGFFAYQRSIIKQARPAHLSSHGLGIFDQGLGRSIWFRSGGVVTHAAETIESFEPDRRPDIWTGAAMACSFAGGTDLTGLHRLQDVAGTYQRRLSWAAATAAWTRFLAGNPAQHTDQACKTLSGITSSAAAQVLEQGRRDLVGTSRSTSYQSWRQICTPRLLEGN